MLKTIIKIIAMKQNIFMIVVFCLFLFACKSNKKPETITLQKKDSIQKVEIVENDYTKTVINLKGAQIESIIKYVNNKMTGEQLSFHKNGFLSKKLQTLKGITEGHRYEFYESGAFMSHTYYKDIYPAFFGTQYWDGPYGLMKSSIHYKDRGEIERVRIFDTLGNFSKDSVPY